MTNNDINEDRFNKNEIDCVISMIQWIIHIMTIMMDTFLPYLILLTILTSPHDHS